MKTVKSNLATAPKTTSRGKGTISSRDAALYRKENGNKPWLSLRDELVEFVRRACSEEKKQRSHRIGRGITWFRP